MMCLAAAGCAAAPARGAEPDAQVDAADTALAIDEFMCRTVAFGFSGSLLVAKQGRVLVSRGYGHADRAGGVPYTERAVFSIGSITKQFTAAAILKLEMDERLTVLDPIADHLPGVPDDKSGITLQHLLTHTSGLRSDFGQGDFEALTRDEFLRRALSSELQSEPGKAFAYSNAGYGLLAAVVEIVSGQPYESFVDDQLFRPAGMTSTGFPGPYWERALVPHGYEGEHDRGSMLDRVVASPGPYWNLTGNGGVHSTLEDLYRWDRALLGTRVLSEAAKQELFAPHTSVGVGTGTSYAYGWYVSETPWHARLIAHTGGDGVFFAGFRRYVDDDVTLIHSSNVASLLSEYPVRFVEDILFGRPYALPPKVVAMPAAVGRFEGKYRLESGDELAVDVVGETLRVTPRGTAAFEAFAGVPGSDRASLARHQEETESILRARDGGDFAPLAEATADGSTPADLAQVWERYLEEELPVRGDYTGFAVLGSRPAGTWTVTHVRLDFAKVDLLLDYLWNGGKLLGVQLSAYPGYFLFRPTGERSFASYDVSSGESVALAFTLAADTLTVASRGRTLSAAREDPRASR